MYIKINKQDILFEENMDYDSEQKERAKQNAINSCDKLHLLIEINCIGRQIFIFLSIIHVVLCLWVDEYRYSISLFVLMGLFLLQLLFALIINKKQRKAEITYMNAGADAYKFVKAENIVRKWRNIIKQVDKKSTMLDFSRDSKENILINAFWVDEERQAHNEIFNVPKEMVEYVENKKVLIKLKCPLNEENYIQLQLPKVQ